MEVMGIFVILIVLAVAMNAALGGHTESFKQRVESRLPGWLADPWRAMPSLSTEGHLANAKVYQVQTPVAHPEVRHPLSGALIELDHTVSVATFTRVAIGASAIRLDTAEFRAEVRGQSEQHTMHCKVKLTT